MRVGICTTVWRPPLFRWWIDYHRSRGFERILVFIDDEADNPVRAEVKALEGVTLIRCDAAYWEERLARTEPLLRERVRREDLGLDEADLDCD